MYDGFKFTLVFKNAFMKDLQGVIYFEKPCQSFRDISDSIPWQAINFSGQRLSGQVGAPVPLQWEVTDGHCSLLLQVILCGSGSGDSGVSAVAQLPYL